MDLPEVEEASRSLDSAPAEIAAQDTASLRVRTPRAKGSNEMPELKALRKKSIYGIVAKSETIPVSSVDGDQLSRHIQTVSAVYRKNGQQETDCSKPALSVGKRVKKDPSDILEIVDRELRGNPDCGCEIVKAAIQAKEMKVSEVVDVVTVAIEVNPEDMRLIAQCAIAVRPDALSGIQTLLAKYGTSAGYSAKSSKSAKGKKAAIAPDPEEVAAAPNPLDLPGGDIIGLSPTDLTNYTEYVPVNVVVLPPVVTFVDP